MIILCTQTNDSSWLAGFVQYFFAPFAVAAISYYLFGLRDEYKNRRNYSRLGVEQISTLIEEVETGLKLIKETLDPNHHVFPNPLPRKSWSGISTIQDQVLLRILAVCADKPDKGFPSREIRIHCKNYFEHIVTNWDAVIQVAVKGQDYKAIARTMSTYEEATTGVLEMLKNIKHHLSNNIITPFPK
ncbi:MAG: hypothetical protein ACOZCO_05640 [Bacteroidota bacterium]